MPGDIISSQVGQHRNEIGNEFWKRLRTEHCVGMDGYAPPARIEDYNFSQADNFRYVPRAVLIDLEPRVINSTLNVEFGKGFYLERVFSSGGGAGNNWASGCGAGFNKDSKHGDQILNIIQSEVEISDKIDGFSVSHSIVGGTGSGLGSWILEKLVDEYGHKQIQTFSAFPTFGSDVVVQLYTAILTFKRLIEIPQMVTVLDNVAIEKNVMAKTHIKDPSMKDVNAIIERIMAGITSSKRFGAPNVVSLFNLSSQLCPVSPLHFIQCGVAPMTPVDPKYIQQTTATHLMRLLSRSDCMMTRPFRKYAPSQSDCLLSVLVLFQGEIDKSEAQNGITKTNSLNPYGSSFIPLFDIQHITSYPNAKNRAVVLALTHSSFEKTLATILHPVSKLFDYDTEMRDLVCFQVFVRMDNGKIHPFDVLSLDTVFVVKKKIFIKYGIPTRLQRLFFGAKQLEDGRTLADCLIKKSSFIQLSFGLPGGTRIEIKILAGDKVPTFSVSGDTVNEIKSDIFKQKSIPVDEQRLFYGGEELLGISKVSHIQSKIVLICPKAKGVVFEVHTYKNQKIDLVVGDKETLYEIKAKIREIEDITVEQQKISFAGVYYQDYYMRAMKLCDVNDKTTATKIRQMVCDKPHHTQRIIFADISPSAIETLFVEEDSENNDNKVYYTPKKLIEKAFEYLSNHDPTIGSELAWAAAFYTIKLFYLRMGIHNISHRSIKWLAYTAIDTLQPKHQKKLKKLFARAESCHKYFNGSRDDEDILKYDIEDVENFVKKFQDIPHEPVEEKMKEFMRDNDKYDDGTIGYRLENKILSEFAGKFAVNTRVVFY